MKPEICPFCGSGVSLVDSTKVYGQNYGSLYLCDSYPKCDARVGCHPGTVTPLGTLANKELRQWRNKAHSTLDPLWKSGKMSRNAAYKWLAQQMGLRKSQTHIGMFNKQQCQRVIAAVEKLVKAKDYRSLEFCARDNINEQ